MTAPVGRLLGKEAELWEAQGPGLGMVVVLGENGKAEEGFVFRAEGSFGEAFLTGLKSRTGKKVKVVVSGTFRATVESWLHKAGIKVEKIVTRDEPFMVRFVPGEGRLLVSRPGDLADALPQSPASPSPASSAAAMAVQKAEKVKVLVIDDSSTIRKLLTHVLSSDPDIEVVGAIGLPSETEAALQTLKPDVVTLDIHLPEMNGVELLKRYLPHYKVPTVMISSISLEEGPLVLNALEAGAVDYIQKPSASDVAQVSPLILLKVKQAKGAKVRVASTAPARMRSRPSNPGVLDQGRLIAVGSSTGGTEALKEVLLGLPENIPPIVVVQHIPAVFSKAFADRLNGLCPFKVTEGQDGEPVEPGKVIIAPGGFQMSLRKTDTGLFVKIEDAAPVNRHKPSVDVLFHSVAKWIGKRAIGVMLTGMGADGAQGMLEMKKAGAETLAQDEATCVVFGMPQAAQKVGATDRMVPLGEIAACLTKLTSRSSSGRVA